MAGLGQPRPPYMGPARRNVGWANAGFASVALHWEVSHVVWAGGGAGWGASKKARDSRRFGSAVDRMASLS